MGGYAEPLAGVVAEAAEGEHLVGTALHQPQRQQAQRRAQRSALGDERLHAPIGIAAAQEGQRRR